NNLALAIFTHAANAAAGGGPGSHGCVTSGSSSMICSEPQTPHRRVFELETVSQFLQKTALSIGTETSPGSVRIIVTLRMIPPELLTSMRPAIKRRGELPRSPI